MRRVSAGSDYPFTATLAQVLSRLVAPGFVLIAAVLPDLAIASVIIWDGNGNAPPVGSYGITGNWSPNQVPASGDTAAFVTNDDYSVMFTSEPAAVGGLEVLAGNVAFTSLGSAKTLSVNAGGNQDVTIADGARLELGGIDGGPVHLVVGGELEVQQDAVLQNNSQISVHGNITIDGGAISTSPLTNGTLNLAAGRTMTVTNGGSFNSSGAYTTPANTTHTVSGPSSSIAAASFSVNDDAQVYVFDGGSLTAGPALNVGNSSNGTFIAEGASTSVTALIASPSQWGSNGGHAVVSFTDNASGFFLGGLNLASTSTPGTTAIVHVLNGADLTTGRLRLANQGGASTSATIDVQGEGSTVTLADSMNNFSIIGHASQGTARINVGTTQSGAAFNAYAEVFNIENTGTLAVGSSTTSGAFTAPGGMNVKGAVNLAGGQMTVSQTLTIDPIGDFNFTGGTLRLVNIDGSLQNQGGVLAPGLVTPTIGTLQISGDYEQSDNSTLLIELGNSATEFDRLQSVGAIALDGTLAVQLRNRVPLVGESFQVVTAGAGLTGEFANFALPSIGAGLDWSVVYGSDFVTLEVVTANGLTGDYTNDGSVSAADFVLWKKLVSTPAFNLPNERVSEGRVTSGDYGMWRTNFGRSAVASTFSHNLTPEPEAMMLTCLAICAMFARRIRL